MKNVSGPASPGQARLRVRFAAPAPSLKIRHATPRSPLQLLAVGDAVHCAQCGMALDCPRCCY